MQIELAVPREPLGRLFLRFLKFGFLAWGGPVAQIAMIRQELVEDERWISRDQFNRILAVYQVLPGPEAHELCVHFGMLSGGRLGGLLAGLGFMLPGFVLMFLLAALYAGGVQSPLLQAMFAGVQPAVVALIFRAVHRIGSHAVTSLWLWLIAVVAGAAQLVGTSFWVTLPLSGLIYLFASGKRPAFAIAAAGALVAAGLLLGDLAAIREKVDLEPNLRAGEKTAAPQTSSQNSRAQQQRGQERPEVGGDQASRVRLFVSGLRAGLLTFGGAYTVLPFLRRDAVEIGRWMTDIQFLDGVALSGTLPAPFIIFSTFVGYLGGGPVGALVLTIGIFLPAFGFTLLGHRYIERLVSKTSVHTFFDGVTAGVVGFIAATAAGLFRAGIKDAPSLLIFVTALFALYRLNAKWAVAAVMFVAAAVGAVLHGMR